MQSGPGFVRHKRKNHLFGRKDDVSRRLIAARKRKNHRLISTKVKIQSHRPDIQPMPGSLGLPYE